MKIGEAIKMLRIKRDIRQQKLADKTKISQSYLSLVEKGERKPGLELVSKIADSLQVPQQLIFLMACDNNTKLGCLKKPLQNIVTAVDDILAEI